MFIFYFLLCYKTRKKTDYNIRFMSKKVVIVNFDIFNARYIVFITSYILY